jgi:hypothetical protein
MASALAESDVRRGFQTLLPRAPVWYADVVLAFLQLLNAGESEAPPSWLASIPPAGDEQLRSLASLLTKYAKKVGSEWWTVLRRHKNGQWTSAATSLLERAGLDPLHVRAPPGTGMWRELMASDKPQPSMVVLRTPISRHVIVTLDGPDQRR